MGSKNKESEEKDMARLSPAQAALFPSNGGRTNFLSLANDGDSAVIRFAYNSLDDIIVDTIHEVQDNEGKRKVIGCLRPDNSAPFSLCPLCNSGNPLRKSAYLSVFNQDAGEMQIWQRSGGFFEGTLKPLFEEYKDTPLYSVPFKVKRNGAKGDPRTTYSVIPLPVDGTTLEQLGEPIDAVEQGIVKELSFEEMESFVRTGILPSNNQNNNAPSGIQPRGNGYQNFGQPANVENYNQPQQGYGAPMPQQGYPQNNYGYQPQAPANNNRRTINNGNGGY